MTPEQEGQSPAPASLAEDAAREHDLPTQADPIPNGNGHAPSVLDALRRQYADADQERRTTLLIVPGRFQGNLAARYKAVPWSEQRRKIRQAAKAGESEEAELNYGAGVIVDACEEILVRPEPGKPLVPMHLAVDDFKGGEPVRYDPRLAKALGIDPAGLDPVGVCRMVFANPAALNQHFAEVDAFLREAVGGEDEDDEERPT